MKARIGIASEELVRKYILDISGGKIKHVEGYAQYLVYIVNRAVSGVN
ncbi:hypothetical protein [Vibrio alginolyticus]|nr:hypothetical protein [Vibrio alginolyticus]